MFDINSSKIEFGKLVPSLLDRRLYLLGIKLKLVSYGRRSSNSFTAAPGVSPRRHEFVAASYRGLGVSPNCCPRSFRASSDVKAGAGDPMTPKDHCKVLFRVYVKQSIRKSLTDLIIQSSQEKGVKVCLAPGAVSTALSVDYTVLHLIWTTEKPDQQLDLIDQHYQTSTNSALAHLKVGNKRRVLRCAAEMKVAS